MVASASNTLRALGFYSLLLLSFLLVAHVCNAATVGIIRIMADGETTLYSPHRLSTFDEVHFQYTDKIDLPRCCQKRSGAAFTWLAADEAALDALRGETLFKYRLSSPLPNANSAPFMAIAVIGDHLQIEQAADYSLHVKSSNLQQTINACTSQEGFHVIENYHSKVISDLYFSLGYAIAKPTCTATKEDQ